MPISPRKIPTSLRKVTALKGLYSTWLGVLEITRPGSEALLLLKKALDSESEGLNLANCLVCLRYLYLLLIWFDFARFSLLKYWKSIDFFSFLMFFWQLVVGRPYVKWCHHKPWFDPITFTISENSNHWRENLLEVMRQNIAGWFQEAFWFLTFIANAQQCFAFTPQANFPTHNLNLQWRWRWWNQIQATF